MEDAPEITLIFVYNAESGLLNAGRDFLHSNFRPATYPCNLCGLTYHIAWKRPEWRRFLQQLEPAYAFEYRNTLAGKYGISGVALPAVFIQRGDEQPALWIDATAINACATLEELMALLSSRLPVARTPLDEAAQYN